MITKYILIVVFLICMQTVFAQYYEMGERKVLKTDNCLEVFCELILQKDKYCILFTEGTSELSSSFFVSYGRVRKQGNMYYLKDIPCNTEIMLEANNDKSQFVVRKVFLHNDFLYQIHYHLGEYSPIISEGKWSKEGNLLKLYDSFLDYSFTALIDSNKITVIDFPNDVYYNCNYSPVEGEMLPFIVK